MHIFFSGIGGTAIGPLALIAKEAGYEVSGSDKQNSQYIRYLKQHGIKDIHIGQDFQSIAAVHAKRPIEWFVYTSALPLENPEAPELKFCAQRGIRTSKRDELLNQIIRDKKLRLLAVAGTHGKTTTTAMMIWLFKELGIPISYSVGAKISFGDMGEYNKGSEYFVYEADEFDRNFLSFEPFVSIITGVSWDHHEIFPTRDDYKSAFVQFITQSKSVEIWQEDKDYLELEPNNHHSVLDPSSPAIKSITIPGHYNRLDAWLAISTVNKLTGVPHEKIISIINRFPGLQRRMELIAPGLYSDYAHTPEKIRGAMSVASELAVQHHQRIIVIYEPLTNRRMHHTKELHRYVFDGASKVYWVPSYLAREDPKISVLKPHELIPYLKDPSIAQPMELNDNLKEAIDHHLASGDMVVALSGGGGGSLDEFLRERYKQ